MHISCAQAAARPISARMVQTARVSSAQQAFKSGASAKKGFSARASRRNAVVTKAAVRCIACAIQALVVTNRNVLLSQLGDSLEEFLVSATPDPKLRQLMMSLGECIRTIAHKVRAP